MNDHICNSCIWRKTYLRIINITGIQDGTCSISQIQGTVNLVKALKQHIRQKI